jgi:hypothetical protein
MTTFDDRERAFENQFQHDLDLLFRIRARRDRLAGLWAADLMGLTGSEADAYAKQTVETDFGTAGPHELRTRLLGDLQGKGIDISEHRIEKELQHLLQVAHDQVVSE